MFIGTSMSRSRSHYVRRKQNKDWHKNIDTTWSIYTGISKNRYHLIKLEIIMVATRDGGGGGGLAFLRNTCTLWGQLACVDRVSDIIQSQQWWIRK